MLYRATSGSRRLVRAGASMFLCLTILATLGSGEHYVVDLIAAVPFVVAVEALCARRFVRLRRRFAPILVGGGLYLMWVLIARSAPVTVPVLLRTPWLSWVLVTATFVLAWSVALPRAAGSQQS